MSEEKSTKKGISRRAFLKAAGVAGLAAGATGLAAAPVFAYEKTDSALVNFAVKQIDTPCYDTGIYADGSKLKRFDSARTAFNAKEFLDQYHNGKPYGPIMRNNGIKNIKSGAAGYTLLDYAFQEAAWTSSRAFGRLAYSWKELGVADVKRVPEVGGPYKASPEELSQYMKKAALYFGAGACGITTVKEQWFYEKDGGKAIIFSDTYDVPTETEDAKYIPKDMCPC